jgi:hypothetical protein
MTAQKPWISKKGRHNPRRENRRKRNPRRPPQTTAHRNEKPAPPLRWPPQNRESPLPYRFMAGAAEFDLCFRGPGGHPSPNGGAVDPFGGTLHSHEIRAAHQSQSRHLPHCQGSGGYDADRGSVQFPSAQEWAVSSNPAGGTIELFTCRPRMIEICLRQNPKSFSVPEGFQKGRTPETHRNRSRSALPGTGSSFRPETTPADPRIHCDQPSGGQKPIGSPIRQGLSERVGGAFRGIPFPSKRPEKPLVRKGAGNRAGCPSLVEMVLTLTGHPHSSRVKIPAFESQK